MSVGERLLGTAGVSGTHGPAISGGPCCWAPAGAPGLTGKRSTLSWTAAAARSNCLIRNLAAWAAK